MMRKLGIALLIINIVLFGCINTQENPHENNIIQEKNHSNNLTNTTTNKPTQLSFEVHEWGIIIGCNKSRYGFKKPIKPILVKQPVLFIHATNEGILKVNVSFRSGMPTETFPPGKTTEKNVLWLVNVSSEKNRGYAKKISANMGAKEIYTVLNSTDANILKTNGFTTSFLYYEGELSFKEHINLQEVKEECSDCKKGLIRVKNMGDEEIKDVFVIIGDANIVKINLKAIYIPKLESGEEITTEAKEITKGKLRGMVANVMKNDGFTNKEIDAFLTLWEPYLFKKTNIGKWSYVLYTIDNEEYEKEYVTTTFIPKPKKYIRRIWVVEEM